MADTITDIVTDDTLDPIPESAPIELKYAITVDGTMITGVHESLDEFSDNTFAASPELAGQQVIPALPTAEYQINTDIRAYDEGGKIIDLIDAIGQGYIPMPEGYEIVDGELIAVDAPFVEQPPTIRNMIEQTVLQAKQDTVELVEKQAEQQAQVFTALKSVISDLLKDREASVVIGLRQFILDWAAGPHERGYSVIFKDYPYKVVQTHDSTDNSNWTPDVYQAGFAPWHGTTPETALPWKQPCHAEENYLPGEYMWFDVGQLYMSQRNTNFSPLEQPADWWIQYENGEFGPIDGTNEEEPVDPEIPADKNSNGTDAWSEWVPWNSHPATLYKIGDRVTLDGVRYIATLDGNHWSPTSGTGWAVAPE